MPNQPHNGEKLIRSDRVRQICGDVSAATISRWSVAEPPVRGTDGVPFPKPIRLGALNFWRESEVLEFVHGRAKPEAETVEPIKAAEAGQAA